MVGGGGFHAGRGMGTTTLEAKLLQQFITMRYTVLHAIFLDLRKAYNAMDRYRCLDVLVGYRVGLRTLRILRTYWVRLQMAANTGGALRARLPEPPQGNSGVPPVTHDL